MTKATKPCKGKAELRVLAKKSLSNQLKPLINALNENGLERSSTEDIGVHALFRIIKIYQDYFKVFNIIDSFHTGNGLPKDIQKQNIMLDVYIELWLANENKLPPKQTPFKDAVQEHIRKERVANEKGEIISISEESCFDFLRSMKKLMGSALPHILKNKMLDV